MAKCSICAHPARTEIDAQLNDKDVKLREIVEWLEAEYPHVPVPSIQTLSKHKINHLEKQLALGELQISIQDGQLFDSHGRPLETVGIATALKTVVTLGIINMLKDPSRVSTKDVIEALRLMKSMGSAPEELEEMMEVWANSIKRPGKKAKAVVPAVIEATAEVVEESDPWADLDA